nr:hypothetical protein [Aeromonas veronii]
MKHSRRPQDRLSLDALTAGVDLLAQLRRHRFRRLDITVPDDHQLVWFDVFPLAGALALVHQDTPLWVCRWQLVDRVAVIHDWPINRTWPICRWRRFSGCLVVTW